MEVYKDWKYNKIRMEMKMKIKIKLAINFKNTQLCIGFQEKEIPIINI